MDLTYANLLNAFAEDRIIKEVKQAFKNKPVTRYGSVQASGKTAESLEHRIEEKDNSISLSILIDASAEALVKGRKPGERPPISAIEQWLKDKKLDLNAFAVATNIAKKGTTIFQEYAPGESPLFEGILNDSLLYTSVPPGPKSRRSPSTKIP